jgi:N-acyl-D-aspartate/D-glutamate deacylase
MKLKLALLLTVMAGCLSAQDYEILIHNGRIVDGTGDPSFHGDLGIKGGKIVWMGKLPNKTATRTIDAEGLVVAPGFIDMHNHSDDTVLVDGDAMSMITQGVTTMILGEGNSQAPTKRFPRFRDYWAALAKRGVSTNIGSYVASGSVFESAHGMKSGPATPAEMEDMRRMIREGMEDGALGVSTSLMALPGFWISTDELVEMAKVAGEYGGIYSSHTRDEGPTVFAAVSEAIEIGRRANVPVDLLHLKIAYEKLWGQMPELVGLIQNARNQGVDVQAHVYPYTAGQNNLRSIIPPWAQEGGTEEMFKRIKDMSLRDRLVHDIENGIDGWYDHYTAVGKDWSRMQPVTFSNPAYRKYTGKRMDVIIADMKKPPLEALFQILLDNDGSVPTVYFHHSEQDMRLAMQTPWVSFGSDGTALRADGPLSQGSPHPRSYGTYPRIMGRYVREEKVITLEDAVRKATSHNAAKVRIFDRGLLRPGMWADITVFNPDTIIDKATYDNPHQYSVGVEYVIVNGKLVIDRGKHTGARPGTVLYGPGKKG